MLKTRRVCARGVSGFAIVAAWGAFATIPAFAQDAAPPAMIGGTASASPQAPSSPQPTNADGREASIGDIIVTARRVQESLQKVPVAITALTGAGIAQKSILRIEDLSRAVPGFIAQPSYQNSIPVYTIRGQHGDTNPSPNTEPAVAVYFGEVNQGRAAGTTGALFDLQSVEVLKGPQGTLFGRNSTGGAVSITPKAPQMEFGGYAQASGGNYGYHDFEGVLNVPLGDSIGAFRVGGKYTKRDGYIRNLYSNTEDGGNQDVTSLRASLLLTPTDNLTSTTIATYYRGNENGAKVRANDVSLTYFQETFGPNLGAAYYNVIKPGIDQLNALGPYKLYSPNENDNYARDRVFSIQNSTALHLGDHLTLKNIFGYRRARQDSSTDFYGSTTDNYVNTYAGVTNLYTEELQLQAKFGKLDFVTGLYYLAERVNFNPSTRIFAAINQVPPSATYEIPYAFLPFIFPVRQYIENNYSTDSKSAFVHANYDLGSVLDGLSISAGVRVTQDVKKVVNRSLTESGVVRAGTGYTCIITGVVYPTENFAACSFGARIKNTEPTYDVSVNYQVSPRTLVYVAHRRGYRAGGFDVVPVAGVTTPPSYQPEFVDDAELGLKTSFTIAGMPVRLNTDGYYQWYKDIQRLVGRRIGSVTTNATTNAASAHIYGFEGDLTLRPTPHFELSGTYAYTNAKNVDFIDQYGSPTKFVDVSDSPFSYVPKHQYSITGRYTVPLRDSGEIAFSATFYGQSSMAASDIETTNCGSDGLYPYCLNRARVPAYSLLNLRVDWKNFAGSGLDFSAFANNATNRVYKSTVYESKGPLGVTAFQYGPPAMYGVTLKYAFGGER